MRIQKYLANKGLCSRRKAEEYIQQGLIKLNGKTVTELGTQMDPGKDTIEWDPIIEQTTYTTIVFHKPRGIITNCPQKDEKEIKDLLPEKLKHLNAIGRLDKDSEGLILLTDDGVLAKKLLSHDSPHERVYKVRINTQLTQDMITKMEGGMLILGNKTKPTQVQKLTPYTFLITMIEGKNRQIRRMVQKCGADVTHLKRIRFGDYELSDLEPGDYRFLAK